MGGRLGIRKEGSMLQPVHFPARSTWADDLPVSIVIPLYNEESILMENLTKLAAIFDDLVGSGNWLFILVDNGSTDGTPQLIKLATERWPLSRGMRLAEPNVGEAQKAGLRSATTKWVYMLEIEQWDVPFMNCAWANRASYDVFIASKRADPTLNFQQSYRRLLSAGLNGMLQVFFGFSGTDTHGPKLLNRQSLDSIIAACVLDRGQFDTELVLRATRGRKCIVELPVEYREWRPHRNWMIQKIVWNLLALRRLHRVMQGVPYEGCIKYYRLGREDVLAGGQLAPAGSLEQVRV
jgi:glycosyltransferase involved in cell wall biosynthesis